MIIVNLKGGMGNQMFQYAIARSLAEKNKTEFRMDLTYLLENQPKNSEHVFRNYDLDIFNIEEKIATKKELKSFFGDTFMRKILNKIPSGNTEGVIVQEKKFRFDPEIMKLSGNVYLDGYWQSPEYFSDVEDLIRNEFTFKNEFDAKNSELAEEISSVNAVCLNVRRADFISIGHANKFHGVMGVDYFEKAIGYIASKFSDFIIYIFSDDIDWCRDNIKRKYPTKLIGHEYAGDKFQYYLHHMSLCKHFIIPNSTFAWWAAWLNNNSEKIVVAPKRWFADKSIDTSDLIPENWIRI
jgi:hypothetical protein